MIHTFLDLCSGIGGGRLGLEQLGLKCVGYSDTSRLAKKTYELMHETSGETYYCNLKRIKVETLPSYDMLIAGFPCQTFSVIGRKDGFDDTRGQLIFHIARILEETQPKCFLLENVKGLVTHDKGKTIQIITAKLKQIGYDVTYKVLTSLEHGVPQMRQRVYFVGIRKDLGLNIDDYSWPEPVNKPPLRSYLIDNQIASKERLEILEKYLNNPTNNGKYTVDDIKNMEGKIIDTRMNDLRIYDGKCPTLRAQRDGILYVKNKTIYQLTGYEALLLQGFPKEYADRVKEEVSDRHLLMQAGNAMTVTVITAIAKQILYLFNTKEKKKMPELWKEFEIDCTEYLNQKFGDYATFTHQGEEDSTRPDIYVETKSGKSFYIDVKHSPAQCGQFVLLPNIETSSFDYSSRNVNRMNTYAQKIIENMNSDFDAFRNAGATGKSINMTDGEDTFSNWVIDIYRSKGVQFFITNDFTMLPIDRFKTYFNISAKYRIKRSGSGAVGHSRHALIKDSINASDYFIQSYRDDGDRLFVTASKNIHNQRFILGRYEYMFSKRGNEYEIRKLSNTYNANVIFSIERKPQVNGLSDEAFIAALK